LCETLNHSFIILCLHCIVLYCLVHKTCISFVNGERFSEINFNVIDATGTIHGEVISIGLLTKSCDD